MKQKIVMKVQMNCKKCQTKALQAAATRGGVNFVGLEGGEVKDKVVVIGDGVDAVDLAKTLRKKLGEAHIISIAVIT
ncbi:disease resistance protein Pik-1 [Humulus lupulus]|uniref:disease resistance protein Pik-1 n=1 Tax=Humulus lupulus TaxID=3486 RepID=UPI002B404ACC|nr:disease resistance protein Pik-1 [Humulus lupulus]